MLLVHIALLLFTTNSASAQNYQFIHYPSAVGLPQQRVLSIYQDRQGYLWFGTEGGVARYDGVEFEIFTTAQGLANNRVTTIAEDAAGRLIIGTFAGVSVYDGDGFQPLTWPWGRDDERVRALYPEADGRIWVATDRRLYALPGDEVEAQPQIYHGIQARVVFRDSRRRLWVGSRRGLSRLVGSKLVADIDGIRPGTQVLAIVEDRDGILWLGTDSGLYRGDGATFAPVNDSVLAHPRAKNIYAAAVDPEGALWFGTWGGIIRVDGGRIELVTEAHGLPNPYVRSVFADREGNLWFGTSDGVAKLVPGPFTSYTSSNGLPGNSVRGIAEDRAGRIWVTTSEGVGVIEPEGRVWRLGAQHRFPPNTLPTSIASLPDGSVLIGTRRGLFHWDERIINSFTARGTLPANAVTALLARRSGAVWIGLDSGLASWSDGRVQAIDGTELLRDRSVTALAEDAAGRLWIATDPQGLFTYDEGRGELQPVGRDSGNWSVWALTPDAAAGMWVGTNGEGALRLRSDGVLQLSTRTGLVNDFVRQIVVDRKERVWLYTNRGLDRLDTEGELTHFDAGDGLIDLEGSAGAALEDSRGNLWFGTARGVMRYDPQRDRIIAVAPLIQIQRAMVGETPLSADQAVVLSPGQGGLTFDFAGLTFRDELDTAFQYRLLGLTEEWSPPTQERRISYANLPPGKYTFEVQTRNTQGLWSENPARFQFEVRPSIYQTIWFRAVMGLLALLTVAEVYWLRNRHVEREKQKLARLVEARTTELVRETRAKERFEGQVNFMTEHDPVTVLANRTLFNRQLEEAVSYVRSRQELIVVLYIDLDRFSRIDDAFGSKVRDDVLWTVADRLTDCVKGSVSILRLHGGLDGTVARMQGDEFAVLLLGLEDVDVVGMIAKAILSKLAHPIAHFGEELVLTATIGINALSGHQADLASLLGNARTAMLHAKDAGGNDFCFYETNMATEAPERISLESQLHRALEREEFTLRYQPIVDANTGEITSVEALIRWKNSRHGRVTPDLFIPIAEEAGLIKDISEWVLRAACRDCKRWGGRGLKRPRVAVNLSALDVRQPNLVDTVVNILDDVKLSPQFLEFELTERVLIDATGSVKSTLNKLRHTGISFSIDDFGTGYSSLSYLNRFPIDTLKIDRSFVEHLLERQEDQSLVSAIIAMAHGLHMRVIAEGVESAEQLEFLRERGCDLIQGYLISKPLPVGELEELLRAEAQVSPEATQQRFSLKIVGDA